MRVIHQINKTETGAPVLPRFAYLYAADEITRWFTPKEADNLYLPYSPLLRPDHTIFRLYLTKNSQEYNVSSSGKQDATASKISFSGNHPGSSESAWAFIKRNIGRGFVIMLEPCNNSESTIILGTECNPLIMLPDFKASKDGRKFTFKFEQEIESDIDIYFGKFRPWEKSEFRYFDKTFGKTFN